MEVSLNSNNYYIPPSPENTNQEDTSKRPAERHNKQEANSVGVMAASQQGRSIQPTNPDHTFLGGMQPTTNSHTQQAEPSNRVNGQPANKKLQTIHTCYGVALDSKHGRIIHKNRLVSILRKYEALRGLAKTLSESYEYYIVLDHFYKENEKILHKYRENIENDIGNLQSDFIKTALSVICEVVDDLASEGVYITGGLKKSLILSEKSNNKRAMPFNDIDIIVPSGFEINDFIHKMDEKSSAITAHQGTTHYNKSDYLKSIQTIPIRPNDLNRENKHNPLWLDFCTLNEEASVNTIAKDEIEKTKKIKNDYQPLQCYLTNQEVLSTSGQHPQTTISEQVKRNIETLSKANFFLGVLEEIALTSKNLQAGSQNKLTDSLHVQAAVRPKCTEKPANESTPIKKIKATHQKKYSSEKINKDQSTSEKVQTESSLANWPKSQQHLENTKRNLGVKTTKKRKTKKRKVAKQEKTEVTSNLNSLKKDTIERRNEIAQLNTLKSKLDKKFEAYCDNTSKLEVKRLELRKKIKDLHEKVTSQNMKKVELNNRIVELREKIKEQNNETVAVTVNKKNKKKKKRKKQNANFHSSNSLQESSSLQPDGSSKSQEEPDVSILYKRIQTAFAELKGSNLNFGERDCFTHSAEMVKKIELEIKEIFNPNILSATIRNSEEDKISYLSTTADLLCNIYYNLDLLFDIHFKIGARDSEEIEHDGAEKILRHINIETTRLTFESIFYYFRNYSYGQQATEQESLKLINSLLNDIAELKQHASIRKLVQASESKKNNLDVENYLTVASVIFKYLFKFESSNLKIDHLFINEISGGVFPILISGYLTSIGEYRHALLHFNKWFHYISTLTQDDLDIGLYNGHKQFMVLIKEPKTMRQILREKEKYGSYAFKNSLTYDLMFNIELNDSENVAKPISEDYDNYFTRIYEGIKDITKFFENRINLFSPKKFIHKDYEIIGSYENLNKNCHDDLKSLTYRYKAYEKYRDKKAQSVLNLQEVPVIPIKQFIFSAYLDIEILFKFYCKLDTESLESLRFNIPEKILCAAEISIINSCTRAIWVYFNLYFRGEEFNKRDDFKKTLYQINELINHFSFVRNHFQFKFEELDKTFQQCFSNIEDLLTYTAVAFKHLFNFTNTQFSLEKKIFNKLSGTVFPILISDYLLSSGEPYKALYCYKKWSDSIANIHQRDLSLTQRKASEFSFNFLLHKDTKEYIKKTIKPLLKEKENVFTKTIQNIDIAPSMLYERPASDYLQKTNLLNYIKFKELVGIDSTNQSWS